jgi:hypothetical protein
MSEVATWPEATAVSAKSLQYLGNRAAVNRVLARLSRRGELFRIGHGLYVRQIRTRFGLRSPEVSAVLSAIQADSGEIIAPGGGRRQRVTWGSRCRCPCVRSTSRQDARVVLRSAHRPSNSGMPRAGNSPVQNDQQVPSFAHWRGQDVSGAVLSPLG